ncbi:hypothetical protein [Nostoc sp.]|uniref:hypothetical protein n=1 Tax=Nostoc sp. TaxID=1180 RepID=UPI002FF4D25A
MQLFGTPDPQPAIASQKQAQKGQVILLCYLSTENQACGEELKTDHKGYCFAPSVPKERKMVA